MEAAESRSKDGEEGRKEAKRQEPAGDRFAQRRSDMYVTRSIVVKREAGFAGPSLLIYARHVRPLPREKIPGTPLYFRLKLRAGPSLGFRNNASATEPSWHKKNGIAAR